MKGIINSITFQGTARCITKGVGSKANWMNSAPDETIMLVCETAADVLESPLDELPPLSDAIDPDALCAIVSSRTNALRPGVVRPRVTVAFDYAGLEIFVSSDDMVYAQPISATDWGAQQRSYQ